MNVNGDSPEDPAIQRQIHYVEINGAAGLVVTFKDKHIADHFLNRLHELPLIKSKEFIPVSRPQLHYKGGTTGRQEVHILHEYTDKMSAIIALLVKEFTLPPEAKTVMDTFLRNCSTRGKQ